MADGPNPGTVDAAITAADIDRATSRNLDVVRPEATRGVVIVAGLVTVVLMAFSSRYGFHRDELYFLAAGRHPDCGYADQGPLTPLIARAMSAVAPGSLPVLRLPSAVAAGVTVLLTGLLARELGGSRRAGLLASDEDGCRILNARGSSAGVAPRWGPRLWCRWLGLASALPHKRW